MTDRYRCPKCGRTYTTTIPLTNPPICTNWAKHRPTFMQETPK